MVEVTRDTDARWDMHTQRQVEIAKSGALAVTLLNSGSWLALLSQAGTLKDVAIGSTLGVWGAGALFGTLVWLFIYFNATAQMKHDFDRKNQRYIDQMQTGIRCGYASAIAALLCFGLGVISLACAFL